MKKGNLSSWHSIELTKASRQTLNKITFQDINNIIQKIENTEKVQKLIELRDSLLKHVIDLNNPHEEKLEQFKYQVIDIFYNEWLLSGFTGDINTFINILFLEIVMADKTEILNPNLENRVPSVGQVHERVVIHDLDLLSHNNAFGNLPPIKESNLVARALYKWLTIPEDIQATNKYNFYRYIPISDVNYALDTLVFKLNTGGNRNAFSIHTCNNNRTIHYAYSTTNIQLCLADLLNETFINYTIPLAPILSTIGGKCTNLYAVVYLKYSSYDFIITAQNVDKFNSITYTVNANVDLPNDMNFIGNFNINTQYEVGDIFMYNNRSNLCIARNTPGSTGWSNANNFVILSDFDMKSKGIYMDIHNMAIVGSPNVVETMIHYKNKIPSTDIRELILNL